MTYKNLKIESADPGIRILKVSRPAALNALNTDTLDEMKSALTELANDASVRVVLLTGDGEKSFIAGADISEMKDKTPTEGVRFAQLGHEVTKLLELMPKPTVAVVNGYALGGGCEMAISCDFIIASEKAVFGQPEVGLGIIPGFGATIRLSKFVGLPRAKELIFTGRRFKADEAKAMGLVNEVYPPEKLQEEALNLARQMSSQGRLAVSKAKDLMNEFSESVGLNQKLDAEAQTFGRLFGSEDQREGMGAFVEKRKPKFQGLEA